jgi:hypothetical protein
VLIVLAMATGSANAAQGPKAAEQVATKTLELEEALDAIIAQTDSVIDSLKELATADPPDRPAAFSKYAKELGKTNKLYKQTMKASETARKQREDYMKAWKKEADKIQNEALTAVSAARRAELTPLLDKIGGSLRNASTDYAPMLQNLNDIELFLGSDVGAVVTPPVTELIRQAESTAASVASDCRTAKSGIRELATRLSPTKE